MEANSMDISQIQKRIGMLEKISKEVKDAREMLNDELENDQTYIEASEEVNEANSKKKRIKEEILGRGPNLKLSEDIKANNEELKTLKEILSAELTQVWGESQSDEITDHNGEVRKFQVGAKLLPKKGTGFDRDHEGKFTPGGE